MIENFIKKFLAQAKYEMIDNGRYFYAEIKSLRGVWAKGKTLEECRENLQSSLEGWLVFRLRNHLPVPMFKVQTKVGNSKTYA